MSATRLRAAKQVAVATSRPGSPESGLGGVLSAQGLIVSWPFLATLTHLPAGASTCSHLSRPVGLFMEGGSRSRAGLLVNKELSAIGATMLRTDGRHLCVQI